MSSAFYLLLGWTGNYQGPYMQNWKLETLLILGFQVNFISTASFSRVEIKVKGCMYVSQMQVLSINAYIFMLISPVVKYEISHLLYHWA